jgi:phosphotransferase system  glucose/maltose/N-acetylglucosamine-specific IIC component
LVLSRGEDDKTRIAVLAAYQHGFRIVFWVGAALAGLAFFVALAMMKQVNLDREDDEVLKKEAAEVVGEKKRKEGEV